jgi:hypothetical protein
LKEERGEQTGNYYYRARYYDPNYVHNGWSVGGSNFRYLGKDEKGNMFNILSGSGWREGSYESTVENLRSSIYIHEVDGHGKNK